ncbi:TadE/TadG family type IV pilus assembly protein [Trinickia fusca]|nr:TadE family protein [Trinickia fusca]
MHASPPRLPLHRRAATQRGAVALEYALVLPLFLVAVFAVFQFSAAFITQALLDNAAHHAARLARIGTMTGGPGNYGPRLTALVCDDLTVGGHSFVPSCARTIQIYVAAANSGAPAGSGFLTLAPATVNGTTMTQTKAALGPRDDVVLQIGYAFPWALFTTSANAMLVSTLVFQTEPY